LLSSRVWPAGLFVRATISDAVAVRKLRERVYCGFAVVTAHGADGEPVVERVALVDHPDALGKKSGVRSRGDCIRAIPRARPHRPVARRGSGRCGLSPMQQGWLLSAARTCSGNVTLTLAMTGSSGTYLAPGLYGGTGSFSELARGYGLLGRPGRAPDPVASPVGESLPPLCLVDGAAVELEKAMAMTRGTPIEAKFPDPFPRFGQAIWAIWASECVHLGNLGLACQRPRHPPLWANSLCSAKP
jgi:hypothetical protein